jgi:hypothetical protein
MHSTEENIREVAYRIWQEEGCPNGRAEIHWERAKERLAIENDDPSVFKAAPSADKTSQDASGSALEGERETSNENRTSGMRTENWFGFGRRR